MNTKLRQALNIIEEYKEGDASYPVYDVDEKIGYIPAEIDTEEMGIKFDEKIDGYVIEE